jgi:GxxExxY protein
MSMDENALSKLIIGAAIEVHRHLGPGLLENAYQAALECELASRNIAFERQKMLPVLYKGNALNIDYRLDLLVDSRVVVELKAVESVTDIHLAQVLTYLRLSGCQLGLLLNFNVTLMQKGIHRVVFNLSENQPVLKKSTINLPKKI